MTIVATKYKKNVKTPCQNEIIMVRKMLDDLHLQMRYNSKKIYCNAYERNLEEVKHIENINIEHYKQS
jgi:hypothetical protein